MTPRLCSLFVVFLSVGAGCASPAEAPAKTPELVVPPMPASSDAPARPQPLVVEPKKRSYEEALADWNAHVNEQAGPPTGPDMTDAELSAPMRNAAFIAGCGAPDDMKVTVRVAVQRGRAIGVSIHTTPSNETVARCVDEHVRGLRWPAYEKMDSFTSTY